ncbi:MAG: phosphate-starvation-inducible PsiE family protein [Phycisphaerae bacterium]|nr:phosphate-starvation-inducible PsiE family protein [Phycisphaerae bacterium]
MKKVERAIIWSLMVMMTVVVVLATIELAYVIAKDMVTPPVMLLEIGELLEIFGLFLLILIGLELMETMRTYMFTSAIRVQVVFLVALIALARKVIILDPGKYDPLALVGIGVVVIALSVGYFIVRENGSSDRSERE